MKSQKHDLINDIEKEDAKLMEAIRQASMEITRLCREIDGATAGTVYRLKIAEKRARVRSLKKKVEDLNLKAFKLWERYNHV